MDIIITLRKVLTGLAFIVSFSFIISCSSNKYTSRYNYKFSSVNGVPDYADLNYWASHPWKNDPADEVPADIKNKTNDTIADVFFIYPTSYTDASMPMGWNANIDDEALNKKTDNSSILYQASVFNAHCRVFAPRYRQANLKAFYTADKSAAAKAFSIAYEDIKTAFEYYLAHYNNGRKIIIASHSQGTLHAAHLLKEYFENKPLKQQLVCAYIIGLPVFTNYFTSLEPCKDSTSTECFVSWRTFQENYTDEYVDAETQKAYVTNPLTWQVSEEFAPATLNKGGILKNFNNVIPGLVHAQVHGNVLWVNKPKFFGNVFLTLKNYHIADYNLFYMNIRENMEARLRTFRPPNF